MFRFRRHVFVAHLAELQDDLMHNTRRSCALLPAQQLGIALAVFGGNTFQSHAAFGLHVAQPTVSRCVDRVLRAVLRRVNSFIVWPTGSVAREVSNKFFDLTGVPGIVGAVDGTHCRIQAPSDREFEFVNRKQYHSINCMVIATPQLTAIAANAKFPGRSHDSRIFRESVVYSDLTHRRKDGILLGDSAYRAERASLLSAEVFENYRSLYLFT
ncbi:hypothetical protein QR680_014589 [Steinernema hermaphroditum]|uniref:Putative nuclease HARBI1 n=1 Tax=Steinernema hermaphroditum TaxID=289476 RepID=A0AA39M4H0_9BILA|nr:hypothetical protein QR680_014589 [Steinernema hermaphroditum]